MHALSTKPGNDTKRFIEQFLQMLQAASFDTEGWDSPWLEQHIQDCHSGGEKDVRYSQISLQSDAIRQCLYNNTHAGNYFTGLCTECAGYNNNLVIAAQNSGTNGVVVKSFDCNQHCPYVSTKMKDEKQILHKRLCK